MAFLQRKFAHPGLLPTLYSSFSEDIIYYLPLLGRLELRVGGLRSLLPLPFWLFISGLCIEGRWVGAPES